MGFYDSIGWKTFIVWSEAADTVTCLSVPRLDGLYWPGMDRH